MAARGKKLLKVKRRAEFKHTQPTIRRDDHVQVISGDEKGKTGKILKVHVSRERVVVEGANMIFKHVKKSQQNPQGGRVQVEAPIAISNVLLLCSSCGQGRRSKAQVAGGKKVRVCSKCGSKLGS